jgi:hypothetical protein
MPKLELKYGTGNSPAVVEVKASSNFTDGAISINIKCTQLKEAGIDALHLELLRAEARMLAVAITETTKEAK